jgi:ribosomal subunit interface protein
VNVHYTGRQQSVTPQVRKQVEARLKKIQKIFGPRPAMETHVILKFERYLHRTEITVNFFDHAIVGAAEAKNLRESVDDALDRLEKQALKDKTRWRVKTRHARPVATRSIRTLGERGVERNVERPTVRSAA